MIDIRVVDCIICLNLAKFSIDRGVLKFPLFLLLKTSYFCILTVILNAICSRL